MQQRSLGCKNDLFGEPSLQIARGELRRRIGGAVIVALVGGQVSRRIAIARTIVLVGVLMRVGMAAD